MPLPCRLLIDPPGEGCWNMAVDQAILAGCDAGRPTLRFYQWSRATLSLGYFQRFIDRQGHRPSLGCPLVRRSSGGGAILHDHELTYSLIVPRSSAIRVKRESMVDAVHAALIDALAELGVPGCGAAGNLATAQSQNEPFLCFQRTAPMDVMLSGSKICGSAQRRTKTAYLQHGSLLLRRSSAAPELPGVCDLAAVDISADVLREAWSGQLAAAIGLDLERDVLHSEELAVANRLCDEQYGSFRWTEKR